MYYVYVPLLKIMSKIILFVLFLIFTFVSETNYVEMYFYFSHGILYKCSGDIWISACEILNNRFLCQCNMVFKAIKS